MKVTFRCDGKVLKYKPGKIYEEVLTSSLEALLRNGSILVLIDPLSLDAPLPKPVPFAPKPEPIVPMVVRLPKEEIEKIKHVEIPKVLDTPKADTPKKSDTLKSEESESE